MDQPTAHEPQLFTRTFRSALTGTERAYWLYLPRGYREDGPAWPVILFLHGGGERGEDPQKVLKNGPIREVANGRDLPFILIAPQMPSRPADAPPMPPLTPWPQDQRKPMVREPAETEREEGPLGPPNGWHESEHDLLTIVDDVLGAYHADADRVYLTGLSYGGFGAWYMATWHPDRWAAVAPICGVGDPAEVHRIGKTPVWLFQGGRDWLVLPQRSLRTADALDAAGGNVRVTVHEDLGHDCWTRAYGGWDLYAWFLSHTRQG
jgi:predicted peptidase